MLWQSLNSDIKMFVGERWEIKNLAIVGVKIKISFGLA